ncbi:MAG: HD-GYP domain-containing protein [Phycisphaerales bacterium]
MMLCGINEVTPGSVLGTEVVDPRRADHILLRAGVALDAAMIGSLAQRGVVQLWIEDSLAPEVDGRVAEQLSSARLEAYVRLRDDLRSASARTVSVASVQAYRQAVMNLITQAISSAPYAGMTDALFQSGDLANHSVNVAYLSLLTALHAESYVVAEQPRLPHREARDMTVVGLAGMLHDIGKASMKGDATRLHEVHAPAAELPEDYVSHCEGGRRALEAARVPARVLYAVLNHHQRFDGNGWPDVSEMTGGRVTGRLAGRRIHVVSRIVSACNVLENLLRDAEGARRPAVAALQAFASPRFDGWFDPMIRHAVLLRVPPFAVGTRVRLSDARHGVVSSPSLRDPCRPTIRVARGAPGANDDGADSATESVDLAARPDLFITHALGEEVAKFLYAAPMPVIAPDTLCSDDTTAAFVGGRSAGEAAA